MPHVVLSPARLGRIVLLIAAGLAGGPLAAQNADAAPETPAAGTAAWAAWCEHVVASADELAFERIPWVASFAEGLRRSRSLKRPMLFYAMNGHPLGCT